jgi:predicted RNase H-like HicB family nuclease
MDGRDSLEQQVGSRALPGGILDDPRRRTSSGSAHPTRAIRTTSPPLDLLLDARASPASSGRFREESSLYPRRGWYHTPVTKFTVILSPEAERGYSVICPAIPGCVSQGETLEEVKANILDALEGCLAVREDQALQEARAVEELEV